jgi:hypothetical protein
VTPPTLFSIVLGSAQPSRLAAWYLAAFNPTEVTDCHLDFGGFWLRIEPRADVADRNPEPGRVILNIQVADAHAVADRLHALGVSWIVELEEREGALLGTLMDPDGNYLQIVQLGAPPKPSSA